MEKFKINVKEIDLEVDEIIDSIDNKNKIKSLIERLYMDYPENMSKLLHDFLNTQINIYRQLDLIQ